MKVTGLNALASQGWPRIHCNLLPLLSSSSLHLAESGKLGFLKS